MLQRQIQQCQHLLHQYTRKHDGVWTESQTLPHLQEEFYRHHEAIMDHVRQQVDFIQALVQDATGVQTTQSFRSINNIFQACWCHFLYSHNAINSSMELSIYEVMRLLDVFTNQSAGSQYEVALPSVTQLETDHIPGKRKTSCCVAELQLSQHEFLYMLSRHDTTSPASRVHITCFHTHQQATLENMKREVQFREWCESEARARECSITAMAKELKPEMGEHVVQAFVELSQQLGRITPAQDPDCSVALQHLYQLCGKIDIDEDTITFPAAPPGTELWFTFWWLLVVYTLFLKMRDHMDQDGSTAVATAVWTAMVNWNSWLFNTWHLNFDTHGLDMERECVEAAHVAALLQKQPHWRTQLLLPAKYDGDANMLKYDFPFSAIWHSAPAICSGAETPTNDGPDFEYYDVYALCEEAREKFAALTSDAKHAALQSLARKEIACYRIGSPWNMARCLHFHQLAKSKQDFVEVVSQIDTHDREKVLIYPIRTFVFREDGHDGQALMQGMEHVYTQADIGNVCGFVWAALERVSSMVHSIPAGDSWYRCKTYQRETIETWLIAHVHCLLTVQPTDFPGVKKDTLNPPTPLHDALYKSTKLARMFVVKCRINVNANGSAFHEILNPLLFMCHSQWFMRNKIIVVSGELDPLLMVLSANKWHCFYASSLAVKTYFRTILQNCAGRNGRNYTMNDEAWNRVEEQLPHIFAAALEGRNEDEVQIQLNAFAEKHAWAKEILNTLRSKKLNPMTSMARLLLLKPYLALLGVCWKDLVYWKNVACCTNDRDEWYVLLHTTHHQKSYIHLQWDKTKRQMAATVNGLPVLTHLSRRDLPVLHFIPATAMFSVLLDRRTTFARHIHVYCPAMLHSAREWHSCLQWIPRIPYPISYRYTVSPSQCTLAGNINLQQYHDWWVSCGVIGGGRAPLPVEWLKQKLSYTPPKTLVQAYAAFMGALQCGAREAIPEPDVPPSICALIEQYVDHNPMVYDGTKHQQNTSEEMTKEAKAFLQRAADVTTQSPSTQSPAAVTADDACRQVESLTSCLQEALRELTEPCSDWDLVQQGALYQANGALLLRIAETVSLLGLWQGLYECLVDLRRISSWQKKAWCEAAQTLPSAYTHTGQAHPFTMHYEALFVLQFGHFIKRQQWELLRSITQNQHGDTVHQLMMGKGKSSVITPMLVLHYTAFPPETLPGQQKGKIRIVVPNHLTRATHCSLNGFKLLAALQVQVLGETEALTHVSWAVTSVGDHTPEHIREAIQEFRDDQSRVTIVDELDSILRPRQFVMNSVTHSQPWLSREDFLPVTFQMYKAFQGQEYSVLGDYEALLAETRDLREVACRARAGQEYGPDVKGKNHVSVIPYQRKDSPMTGSEFSNLILRFLFTLQYWIHMHDGKVTQDMVALLIQENKLLDCIELLCSFNPAWKEWLAQVDLDNDDDDDVIDRVFDCFRTRHQDKQVEVFLAYLYVLDGERWKDTTQQHQVTFLDVIGTRWKQHVIAYTATPYMVLPQTAPDDNQSLKRIQHDPEERVQVIFALTQGGQIQVTDTVETVEATSARTDVMSLVGPGVTGLIDVCGVFLRESNATIASEIAACVGADRPVVFFTKQDIPQVCYHGKTRYVPFDPHMIHSTPFYFYDQRHIVGTDIAQPQQGHAIVLINHNTTLTTFAQAIFRFRKLNAGTTIAVRWVAAEIPAKPHTVEKVYQSLLNAEKQRIHTDAQAMTVHTLKHNIRLLSEDHTETNLQPFYQFKSNHAHLSKREWVDIMLNCQTNGKYDAIKHEVGEASPQHRFVREALIPAITQMSDETAVNLVFDTNVVGMQFQQQQEQQQQQEASAQLQQQLEVNRHVQHLEQQHILSEMDQLWESAQALALGHDPPALLWSLPHLSCQQCVESYMVPVNPADTQDMPFTLNDLPLCLSINICTTWPTRKPSPPGCKNNLALKEFIIVQFHGSYIIEYADAIGFFAEHNFPVYSSNGKLLQTDIFKAEPPTLTASVMAMRVLGWKRNIFQSEFDMAAEEVVCSLNPDACYGLALLMRDAGVKYHTSEVTRPQRVFELAIAIALRRKFEDLACIASPEITAQQQQLQAHIQSTHAKDDIHNYFWPKRQLYHV